MNQQEPRTIITLFHTLPDATLAFDALQDIGVSYECIAICAQRSADFDTLPSYIRPGQQLWTLAARIGGPLHRHALATLASAAPLAFGYSDAETRADVGRGPVAWAHPDLPQLPHTPLGRVAKG